MFGRSKVEHVCSSMCYYWRGVGIVLRVRECIVPRVTFGIQILNVSISILPRDFASGALGVRDAGRCVCAVASISVDGAFALIVNRFSPWFTIVTYNPFPGVLLSRPLVVIFFTISSRCLVDGAQSVCGS